MCMDDASRLKPTATTPAVVCLRARMRSPLVDLPSLMSCLLSPQAVSDWQLQHTSGKWHTGGLI
jgi:hypothetical protein